MSATGKFRGADTGQSGLHNPGASHAKCSNASPSLDAKGRLVTPCMKPGCDQVGSFGFDANVRRYVKAIDHKEGHAERWLGRWYCHGHKGEGRKPESTAEVDPDQLARTTRQESLF